MTARATRSRGSRPRAPPSPTRAPRSFDAVVQRKWVSRDSWWLPARRSSSWTGRWSSSPERSPRREAAASRWAPSSVPGGNAEGTRSLIALSPGGDPLSHRSGFRARRKGRTHAAERRLRAHRSEGNRRTSPRGAAIRGGPARRPERGVRRRRRPGGAALAAARRGGGRSLPVLAGLAGAKRVIDAPGNVHDGQRVEVAGD
jgi:hypothetical protein